MKNHSIELDQKKILTFYEGRAEKYDPRIPEVSMLFQDKNPDLALRRSHFEIEKIKNILRPDFESKVLDVGCGVGRWALELIPLVDEYIGTDFCDPLLKIAKDNFLGIEKANFLNLEASDISHVKISKETNLILFAGVAHYLNDDSFFQTLSNFFEILSKNLGILYFRCPVSLSSKFSLIDHYSEELDSKYSATYRNHDEILMQFTQLNYFKAAELIDHGPLFPTELQNRMETTQYFWIWKF